MAFKRKEFHKEENCLNCGYPLVGKFCGNCGQKAFLHKDSFLHMVAHFVGDYFHYDGKFWATIKTLFTKPGLATLEYIDGKRAKYLNPIQLYIFVTTIFFIVALSGPSESERPKKNIVNSYQKDTTVSHTNQNIGISTTGGKARFGIGALTPKEETIEEYDSVQKRLPPDKRDGAFLTHVRHKSYVHSDDFGDLIRHNFPKVFFLLLPLFAVFLALVFRRQKMYYVDHLIFSVHYHSVFFFALLLDIILINIWTNDTFDNVLSISTLVYMTVYLFLSLKRVYPSPAWKVIIKQLFLFFVYIISFILALVLLVAIIFFLF